MTRLMILVPNEAAARIRGNGAWGRLTFKVSDAEKVGFVHAVSSGPAMEPRRTHFLNSGDIRPSGLWYRVKPELHVYWVDCQRRNTKLKLDGFADFVISGYKSPGAESYLAITHAPDIDTRFQDAGLPDL